MISQSIHIKNYKSIKNLEFQPRKINLFIGDPNAGKSNIIESLSLLAETTFTTQETLKKVVRFENLGNLFYDFNISSPISISADNSSMILKFDAGNFDASIKSGQDKEVKFKLGINGEIMSRPHFTGANIFKPYVFTRLNQFVNNYAAELSSPLGDNIPGLLVSNSNLKSLVSNFLRDR